VKAWIQVPTGGKVGKKVETKGRNGLPDAAACIKNGEPESNTWRVDLLGYIRGVPAKWKKKEKKSKKSGRRNETVVRSEAVSGEKRMKCYPAP
jgi:hypothetical protein